MIIIWIQTLRRSPKSTGRRSTICPQMPGITMRIHKVQGAQQTLTEILPDRRHKTFVGRGPSCLAGVERVIRYPKSTVFWAGIRTNNAPMASNTTAFASVRIP